jgi:hypothetical protein
MMLRGNRAAIIAENHDSSVDRLKKNNSSAPLSPR